MNCVVRDEECTVEANINSQFLMFAFQAMNKFEITKIFIEITCTSRKERGNTYCDFSKSSLTYRFQ